jgi:FkbM family methyltransferase
MWYSDRRELDKISKAGVYSYFNDRGNPVVRMHSSFWLECEREDTAFTIPVLSTGNWEAWNAVAISGELEHPNTMFIDVGANVGYYGVMAACGGTPTWMFEPNPDLVENIFISLALNRASKAAVFNKGLGDKEASMKLYKHENHSGANSLFGTGDDYIEVDVTTLDNIIMPDFESRLDLYDKYVIKVDVEGYERNVWDGAKLLRQSADTLWFCEWVPERFTSAENREWLTEVLETHDLQFVTYDGSFRSVGVGEACQADFEMIVFRKRVTS